MADTTITNTNGNEANSLTDISIGTMCKNNGCKQVLSIYSLFKRILCIFLKLLC